MWLIFGPQIPFCLFVPLWIVSDIVTRRRGFDHAYHEGWTVVGGGTIAGIAGLVLVFGLGILYCAILWKVTSRYKATHGEHGDSRLHTG